MNMESLQSIGVGAGEAPRASIMRSVLLMDE